MPKSLKPRLYVRVTLYSNPIQMKCTLILTLIGCCKCILDKFDIGFYVNLKNCPEIFF